MPQLINKITHISTTLNYLLLYIINLLYELNLKNAYQAANLTLSLKKKLIL